MSAITRGVVAAVLLAGAVAGAAAFPRFLAGPEGSQTPALAMLPGGAAPAIIRAAPLPVQRRSAPLELVPVRIARVSIAPLAPVTKPKPKPQPQPIVVQRVAPPAARTPAAVTEIAPVAAAPTPTPAPAPAPAAPAAPPAAPVAPLAHDKGKGKDKSQSLGSDDHGPPAQAPPGTDNGDSGGIQPVEATDAEAAPSDHGHGPPPWADGGQKGR